MRIGFSWELEQPNKGYQKNTGQRWIQRRLLSHQTRYERTARPETSQTCKSQKTNTFLLQLT